MTKWNRYTDYSAYTEIVSNDTFLMKDLSDTTQSSVGSVVEVPFSTIKQSIHSSHWVDATESDQGVAGNGRTIKDLVDSIGTSEKATLFLPHNGTGNTTTYTLTTSETIPSNIALRIENGAILDGAGTLTINGPFDVGLYRCFGSSITVLFSGRSIREVYAEWWNENTTPGTTDMTIALQAALDSISAAGSPVPNIGLKLKLLAYTYLFTSQLLIDAGTAFESPFIIEGTHQPSSTLYYTGTDDPAITTTGGANTHGRQLQLKNLTLLSDNTFSGTGVNIEGDSTNATTPSMLTRIEKVLFRQWAGTALVIDKAYGVTLRDVWFRSCNGKAFGISGPTGGTNFANAFNFFNVTIESCGATDFVATIERSTSFNWNGGIVEGNSSGVEISYCVNGTLNNLYWESNGTNTVWLDMVRCGPLTILGHYFSLDAGATGFRTQFKHVTDQWFSQILIGNVFYGDATGLPIVLGTPSLQAYPPILINNTNVNANTPITYTNLDGPDGDALSAHLPEIVNGEYRLYDSSGNTEWKVDGAHVSKIHTLANDATPSVEHGRNWLTGGTTTITDFDDGVEGQVITIIAEHSLDITDGTNIFLSGSANWSMTATDTLTLICKADNKWYEIARSDSGA